MAKDQDKQRGEVEFGASKQLDLIKRGGGAKNVLHPLGSVPVSFSEFPPGGTNRLRLALKKKHV